MKIITKISTALIVISFVLSAQAVDLDSARAAKTIRELPSGYVQSTDASTKALETEVNAKRKAAYEEIAKKNNIPVDQVAAQAGKKLIEKNK